VSQKAATALVNMVLGIAIGSLISQVSTRALRRRVVRRRYTEPTSPPSRTAGDGYN
jgi:uncharacterized membrane-anchored protein YhcB (DUF1043 family)